MPVEFSVAEWSNWIPHTKLSSHPPKEMIFTIGTVTSATGQSVQTVGELTPEKRPKAIRLILASIVDNPVRQLDWWLKTARPKLLKPVTSALVRAGNYFSHFLQP
jgi:hypothetical protein